MSKLYPVTDRAKRAYEKIDVFDVLQRYHAATSDKDLIDVLCVGLTEYVKKVGSQSTTIEIDNYCRITVEALQNVPSKTLG